ncbi:MAG TPA: FtsQ-type POTRA domain-containing protein [Candidatus Limnocylindria bacterium]|nr:FtsQ-type POTRA domain-containing protein [Candidatus Limnocylindria bacterium]
MPGQVRIPAAGRLVALLIAAGLASGLVMLVNGPWLRISSVTWAGSRYVSASDLSPILDPFKGTSLLLVDESSLASRLAELPGVASASVEPRFPDGLAVQLSERTPAMLWQTSRARLIVDAGGTVFGELPLSVAVPRELAGLPAVDDRRVASRTLGTGDRIPDAERAAALQLGTIDPRLAGSSATSLRVAIDDRCGYLIGPGSGGWSAALGFHGDGVSGSLDDAPTIDAQMAALRTLFAARPERTVGWVDLRNPGKVYWRPSGSGSDTC